MIPTKTRTGEITPRKILISMAGLFGCGLISLLAAVAVPNTAAGQGDTTPVQFYNSGLGEEVEFSLVPQNCDRDPASRHEGVHEVRVRQTITLNLASYCDWVGSMVGCNAYIGYKRSAQDNDFLPSGSENYIETSGRFTLTKGEPLNWNEQEVRHVTMIRRDYTSDLGCNTYFSPVADITVPAGAEASNQQGENIFAGTTIPVTFAGSRDQCWVVVDRVPSLDNVVDFTVRADGSVVPGRISLVDTVYRAQAVGDVNAKQEYQAFLNQVGNLEQHRCSYTLSFPESVGGMTLKTGTATTRITDGAATFEAEYEAGADADRSAQPAVALAAASDTGYSDSDNLTTSVTPTIEVSDLVVGAGGSVQAKFTRSDRAVTVIEKAFQADADSTQVTFGNDDTAQTCTVTTYDADGEVSDSQTDSATCGLDLVPSASDSAWDFTATQFETGKLPATSDTLRVTIDNRAPQLQRISARPEIVNENGTVEVTFTYSLPVSGLTATDVQVTGGSISEPAWATTGTASGPATAYTATVTHDGEADEMRISVPDSAVTSAAGVAEAAPEEPLVTVVRREPKSAKPTAALKAGQDTGVSSTDGVLSGYQPTIVAGNLVPGAAVAVRATYSYPNGKAISQTRTFQASGATGDAVFGNANVGGRCVVRYYNAAGAQTGQADGDICPLLAARGKNTTVWRVVVTQTEPEKIPAVSDELILTLDNLSPRVDSLTAEPAIANPGGTAQLTIAVSQPVHGFEADDFEVSGGTVSDVTVDPGNNRLYTATFTADSDTNQARVSVIANSFTDLAGRGIDNLNKTLTIPVLVASAKPTIDLDAGFDTANNSDNITRRNAPRFTVANLSNGAAVEVTATRAESDGGSLVLRKSDTSRYYSKWFGFGFGNEGGNCDHLRYNSAGVVVSRVVNRSDCELGDGDWTVVATSRQVGRGPTSSDPLVVTIDTHIQDAPDISFDAARVQVGGTATVTFKFSEPVSGFDLEDDVLVTTGDEISDLAAAPGDNSTYTATFTAGDETGTSTVWAGIGIRGYSDIAGNTKSSPVKNYADIRVTAQAPPPTTTTTTTTTTVPPTTTTTVPEPEAADPEPTPTTVPSNGTVEPIDPTSDPAPDPLAPGDTGNEITLGPEELSTPVASLSPESGFDNIATVGSPVFVLTNLQIGAEIEARVRHDAPNSSTGDFTELRKVFDVTSENMGLQFNNRALGDGPCEMLASSYGWPVAIDEAEAEDCIFLPSEQGLWTLTIVQRNDVGDETQAEPLAITFRLPAGSGGGDEDGDGEPEGGRPSTGTAANLPNLGVFQQSPGISLASGELTTSSDAPSFLLENLIAGEQTRVELRYLARASNADFSNFYKQFTPTGPVMELNFSNPDSGGPCTEETQINGVFNSVASGECRFPASQHGRWFANVTIQPSSGPELSSTVFAFNYESPDGPAPQPEPNPAGVPGLGVIIQPLTASLSAESGEGNVATRPAPTFVLENLIEGLDVRADLLYASDPDNEDSDYAFFAKRFTAASPTMQLNFSDPSSGGECRSSTQRNGVQEDVEAGACQFLPSEQGNWQLFIEQVLSNGNSWTYLLEFEFRLPGTANPIPAPSTTTVPEPTSEPAPEPEPEPVPPAEAPTATSDPRISLPGAAGAANVIIGPIPVFQLENLVVGANIFMRARYDDPSNPGSFTEFTKDFPVSAPSMEFSFTDDALGECRTVSGVNGTIQPNDDSDCLFTPGEGTWTVLLAQHTSTNDPARFAAPLRLTYPPAS